MARALITGSTTGLGEGAARRLLDEGHEIVLHARNEARVGDIDDLARRAVGVVIGDLASTAEVRDMAAQIDGIGGIAWVIHNAGIYVDPQRIVTPEGHARTLAVNVLAPYLLTAWTARPSRLVYTSSGMHARWGSLARRPRLEREALGRRPGLLRQQAVRHDPWVCARPPLDRSVGERRRPRLGATRMGVPGATDDLTLGHATQAWLAGSDDPEATSSGGYWYHGRRSKDGRSGGRPAVPRQPPQRARATHRRPAV